MDRFIYRVKRWKHFAPLWHPQFGLWSENLLNSLASTDPHIHSRANKRKQHRLTPPISNKTREARRRSVGTKGLAFLSLASVASDTITRGERGAHICTAEAVQIFAEVHRCHSRHLSSRRKHSYVISRCTAADAASPTYRSPQISRSSLPYLPFFSTFNNFLSTISLIFTKQFYIIILYIYLI